MKQPEAMRLADVIEGGWTRENRRKAAAELRRLYEENQRLKTVMIAAAEELAKHWEAHCDAEGYGPVNLLRRLEEGIASEYNYTAGSFARLHEANQELLEALNRMVCNFNWGDMNDGEHKAINHARSVIAKATGES